MSSKHISFCVLMALAFASLNARTIHVCSTCDITSIKEAIRISYDGDLILIHKGTYSEGNIVVDKSITLRGLDYPILDGLNQGEILTVTASNVTVEGLQIQNVGTSYIQDRAGIRIRRVKDFVVRNNRLFNTFFGIYIEHSNSGKIIGNEVVGKAVEEMSSGNAIHLWYCKNILVKSNRVAHHRDGIYFEFVDQSTIIQNTSEDNLRYGLHFMFSNEDDYSENIFRRNGAGVAVMFSKFINMRKNRFEQNWGIASYGLLLKEIYDADIADNYFTENTIGIYIEGSTRINYHKNEFLKNGWAMKFSGGCLDNDVSGNNFIANTFDLSVRQNINENQFNGNYWSDYTGYDLNRDGIGDVPYRPVKLFNYIVNKTPEALILVRSLLVDIVNFSERVSPSFTPKLVLDEKPLMNPIK